MVAAPQEIMIGKVSHYYTHIGVAIVEVSGTMRIGDTIHIKGHTTDFTQRVESMQVEHAQIPEATAGQSIGVKVIAHVRQHDVVYKVLK